MKEYDRAKIPPEILSYVESPKNSESAWAERFLYRLKQLEADQLTFTPSRADRYALLRAAVESKRAFTPREFYTSCLFLGLESNTGYTPIPSEVLAPDWRSLDHPQLGNQLGWHFFTGNFTDREGHHYSVELMFWQYTLMPQFVADHLGLSAVENQSLELHLAICDPQGSVQYRANTVIAVGTTGLVEIRDKPYLYRLGLNSIEGLSPDGDLFPVRLRARGWDMGKSPNVEFEIDLSLDNPKGYFFQGDGGLSPSIDGLGTEYYSASLLKLRPGAVNSIMIGGRRIEFAGGRMWYDHQWTTGFMPNGGARHAVLRAANVLATPPPGGWDWFELQFYSDPTTNGEVQLTFASIHSADLVRFYWQTGPTAPGTMTAPFNGKLIDAANIAANIKGTMTVSKWVKVTETPNPAINPPTNTWYPAGYSFVVETSVPARVKEFTLTPLIATGQTGFFGNGLQYTEGGAIIYDLQGVEIGRGFAEGTNWAKTTDSIIQLAGLPVDASTRKLLTPATQSLFLKFCSWLEVLLNEAELKKIMSEAKGL